MTSLLNQLVGQEASREYDVSFHFGLRSVTTGPQRHVHTAGENAWTTSSARTQLGATLSGGLWFWTSDLHSLELTWKWMAWPPSSEDHEIHYKQVVNST